LDAIIGIAAVVAVILSVVNLRLIRIHSSPKPFIKLEYVHVGSHIPAIIIGSGSYELIGSNASTEQDLSPTVALVNIGKGVAVNVNVCANAITKSGESIKVRLEGPSVLIDTINVNNEKVIGKYDSEKKMFYCQKLCKYTSIITAILATKERLYGNMIIVVVMNQLSC